MKIKEFIKKMIYGKRYSSASYINHLRSIGVKIGDDCTIYVPTKTIIDEQYPWMITICSHVRITEGVKILTHDYSWSVLKRVNFDENVRGGVYGASGHVIIGDNVFIGMNAIICRNVKVGNNVIIGAGSVVTKDCQDGCVYAGNPAKKISSIFDFLEKRKHLQLNEATELVKRYFERYGKLPDKSIMREYFMLFSDMESCKDFNQIIALCDNYDDTMQYIKNQKPLFNNFDEFLKYCFESTN